MTQKTLFALLAVGVLFGGILTIDDAYGAVFAKYDGIDGESKDANHDKWIDVLSVDWGMHKQKAKKNRAATNVIEDMTLTIEYEKASPKILEAAFQGKVIPKLEIEQTSTYGGARATYLKYELTNVLVTSFQTNASGNDEAGPPTVVIGNNFEEIKVTYTEFDDTGSSKGNVETTWKVEKGEK
ncbi:MAG: Hcp family type VI secretion system effector [Candidatus Nitrosopumilus sp. bin_32a]|jgi:type VI secretion system secreted protein Hcp